MITRRLQRMQAAAAPFLQFYEKVQSRMGSPGVCDFVAGNPQEMPLPAVVETLQRWTVPQDAQWFAYTVAEDSALEAVAASLTDGLDVPVDPAHVVLTRGAFGALSTAIHALAEEGDEVVFISPPWFFYEAMIVASGAIAVRVRSQPPGFELDLEALEAAITPATRAVIVNSPNNPTGRIYTESELAALAALLERLSSKFGRPIYLISDESYRRILFDGNVFVPPAQFYPRTLVVYTYGKTLLTPGARLGYLALPRTMPERTQLREALFLQQLDGWGFPDTVMQKALPELEELSIDIEALQRRRDRLVAGLREAGYEVGVPQATFYLLAESPEPDDRVFFERMAASDVLVLPGTTFEMPGRFRLSVTASDEMVERALPVFAGAGPG